jgi:hypothetical protein
MVEPSVGDDWNGDGSDNRAGLSSRNLHETSTDRLDRAEQHGDDHDDEDDDDQQLDESHADNHATGGGRARQYGYRARRGPYGFGWL